MKDAAELIVVLDRSGSMAAVQNGTIGGFNRFLADQRAVPGEARLTLIQFNTSVEVTHEGLELSKVPDLLPTTYVPQGGTALLDALGDAIDRTGDRLAKLPEPDRPDKVMVVVLTDGEENSSHKFTKIQVAERVKRQQETYQWQFLFLGANIDVFAEAGKLAFAAADTQSYASSADLALKGMREASFRSTAYRTSSPQAAP